MKNRFRIDSKECIDKEIMDYSKWEMSEFMKDLLFLDYWREIDWKLKNKLDAFNLKWLDDNELEELLNKFLSKKSKKIDDKWEIFDKKITINDDEAIKYINDVFNKALDFYELELKWKLPRKYKNLNINFKNKDEVLNFLKDTTKWIQSSQFKCNIAKIVYSINEIIDTPELLELDKKSEYIIKERIIPSCIIDDYEELINFWTSNWKIIISWKIIDFKLRIRWKEEKSWVFKILKDEKYLTGASLNDSIWIEFEVENIENSTLILSYFYYILFHKTDDNWESVNTIESFKNKWIIDLETIKKLEWKKMINPDFSKLASNLNFKANPMQNMQYKDAKIIWKLEIPKNLNDKKSQKIKHSVELRTILVWNTNEEWLADHRILDTWKIVLTWIRLKWYITESFLKYLVNDLLSKNKDLDKKFSKDELLNYYKSKLIKVERKTWKLNIYTTKK